MNNHSLRKRRAEEMILAFSMATGARIGSINTISKEEFIEKCGMEEYERTMKKVDDEFNK